jgi:competence protein ComEC
MVGVVLLALVWRRGLRPGQSLCLALLAVLALDPLSVLDAGFWLSFAAVALLVLFLSGQDGRGYWRGLLRVQWVLGLGMFPLVLGLFQEASLIAPLTNLFAVPWIGLAVVPPALLAVLLSLVSTDLAALLWRLADSLLQPLWYLLEAGSAMPFSSWYQHLPGPLLLIWGFHGLLLLLAVRLWSLRLLGILLLLPLVLDRGPAPAPGSAWFSLLDVGQGLAAVVRTHRHLLVYDTGARYPSGFNAGDAVLVPMLRARGIRAVDRLVISHGDNDHIGGAEALAAQFPVYSIRTPEPERIRWARGRRCARGERWNWDGVTFSFLYPDETGLRGNDSSCVLRVQAGEHVLLLPGDIEARSERRLLATGDDLEAAVLVAPHHGSLTSSTPPFIAAVRPRWVLFPVGYRNRWNFPRPEVVMRYEARGISRLDTARHGAIDLRLEPGRALEPQSFRQLRRRYWQPPL